MLKSARPLKILTSCRDPGSAGHIDAVLRAAAKRTDVVCLNFADTPASELLQRAGHVVYDFPVPAISQPDSDQKQQLIEAARQIIAEHKPDALLVGVSHCQEAGSDEAFLAASNGLPCYAIQDYWGDVNTTLDKIADIYFVYDECARQLTSHREADSIVVGSAKHSCYGAINTAKERQKVRQHLNIPAETRMVGYFGQMLSHLSGYQDFLRAVSKAVESQTDPIFFVYRPHPKEPLDDVNSTLEALAIGGVKPLCIDSMTAESVLCACDVVLSCFSSCAYDAAYLNRYSTQPLNTALYLLCEPSINTYFHEVTGLNLPPPSTSGLIRNVADSASLSTELAAALQPEARIASWQRAHAELTIPETSSTHILDVILERSGRALVKN